MDPKQATEKPVEDTPFNMAMLFYIRISDLFKRADEAAINNEVHLWFRCSKTIFRRTKFKFNKEEKKEILKLFKEVEEGFIVTPKSNSIRDIELNKQKIILEVAKILDGIDGRLMEIMHKYKMIFPNIEAVGFKKFKERYGLEPKTNA